jgi:voltage-gated potassium channel
MMDLDRKQAFYLIISILIVIDVIMVFYVSFYSTDATLKNVFYAFDLILCIILWLEFLYGFYRSENKKKYLLNNILSIWGMFPFQFVLFRFFRLIKLVQYIKKFAIHRESEVLENFLKKTYLDRIISIAILFVFSISFLITYFDTNITDFTTAFWYIIVSMTGTGYGDVVPGTLTGRALGMVAMIGGILIFATVTAVISSIYVSRINRDSHSDLASKIDDLALEVNELNKKIDELKKEKE